MHFSLNGIIATGFVLSVMVFIHELGHFIVAKACHVKVDVFSLGFGRRLFGFTHGGTDYRVSLLPLGGYVKMAGEIPGEETSGAVDEFGEHPRWQRILIALAGPAANFLLAIALLTGVYLFHNEVEQYLAQPVVLDYVANNSIAAQAGFKTGDRITRVADKQNPDWEDFVVEAALGADHKVATTVQRNGQSLALTFIPDTNALWDDGFVPITGEGPLKIDAIEEDMPAAKAGLKPGDEIIAANAQPIHSIFSFVAYLQDHNQAPLQLIVKRGAQTLNLAMQPVLSSDAVGGSRYRIGIRPVPPPVVIEKQSLPAAVEHSIQQNIKNSGLIFEVIHRMFTFRMSVKQVDGPIGIMRETSLAVQEPGWTPLVMLMSVISLNLGIFNLLPFPILDGGTILMLLVEGILRRDLNPQFKERVFQAAFVVLMLFAVLVIFNDITKLSLFAHTKP